MRDVIVDTGPIVALLNGRDEHHPWARATFDGLQPPLLTCEPVIAEACYLVRKLRGGSHLRNQNFASPVVEKDQRRIAQRFDQLHRALEIGAIADEHMLRAHPEHDLAAGKSGSGETVTPPLPASDEKPDACGSGCLSWRRDLRIHRKVQYLSPKTKAAEKRRTPKRPTWS